MKTFKTTSRFIFLLLFWTLASITVSAQTTTVSNSASTTITLGVTEVSLLRVNDGVINLQLNQRDAGLSVEASKSDSTARLLISSVVSTTPRTMTAKISAGAVPSGSHIELVALEPNSNFVGTIGSLAPSITLDGTEKPFVTDIMTCYSGKGTSDGYPLKFTYAIDLNTASYGNLRATNGTQIIVMFTLTAAQ